MKLIKANFNIIEQGPSIDGIYKIIEQAGRVCYKSEDKIAENSAKDFVERMIKSGHGAMLEHGTVYLKIPFGKMLDNGEFENEDLACWFIDNPYSWVKIGGVGTEDCWYVTSNYRVLIEKNLLYTLQYLCEPTEFHEKRITVKFVCDRGVSHEFVRHRVFSFAQESTRYCNYSKDKFGNELTCIIPNWLDLKDGSYSIKDVEEPYDRCLIIDRCTNEEGAAFVRALCYAEKEYFHLIQLGWKPQQARAVLPNSLKTELVMTGTIEQWKGFFKLRDAGSAHPQAYELAHPLHEEFIKRGYVAV